MAVTSAQIYAITAIFIHRVNRGDHMKKKERLLHWITDRMDLTAEAIPGQFLVEILGHDRILIENHIGIQEYGPERISIKCSYGYVRICGCGLELFRMSKEQLTIRGRIDCISLHRRC